MSNPNIDVIHLKCGSDVGNELKIKNIKKN